MDKLKSRKWWEQVAERAIKTFAEAALSMLAVGMTAAQVEWGNLLSVSIVATLISILTSIATLKEEKE